MIQLNWKSEEYHSRRLTKAEVIAIFGLEEEWPEGTDYGALTEAEVLEKFHDALEGNAQFARAGAVEDTVLDMSGDHTWHDSQIDRFDIEGEVVAEEEER